MQRKAAFLHTDKQHSQEALAFRITGEHLVQRGKLMYASHTRVEVPSETALRNQRLQRLVNGEQNLHVRFPLVFGADAVSGNSILEWIEQVQELSLAARF